MKACGFCANEAVDSIDFETGNGGNATVNVRLCEGHFAEWSETDPEFETKYAEQILKIYEESQLE